MTVPLFWEAPPRAGLLLSVDLAAGRVLLTGELDRENSWYLSVACRALAVGAAPTWVVDLAALEFCDAAGLRALAATRRAAEDAGAVLLLAGARPCLRKLLPMFGLGDVVAPSVRAVSPSPEGARTRGPQPLAQRAWA